MKNDQISKILTTLFGSVFTGIFIVSIGFGAVFPVINQISAPFICRGGHLTDDQDTYHPAPGTTTTTITWFCINDQTGEQKEISPLLMAPVAGTIYGLVIFVIAMTIQTVKAPRRPASLLKQRQENIQTSVEQIKAMGLADHLGPEQYDKVIHNMEIIYPQSTPASKAAPRLMIPTEETEVEKLKKLKELLEADLITQEDYDKKKSEILNRL
jgi:hypothetical protein